MELEPEFTAYRRDRLDFFDRINLPRLGRLRDRHDARLGEMNVRAARCERADRFRGQLAVVRLRHEQLRSVREEFGGPAFVGFDRSEEHTSELQSLMRISYDVFCLKNTTREHRA